MFSPEGIGCKKQTAPRFCQQSEQVGLYLVSIHQMAPPDKQAWFSGDKFNDISMSQYETKNENQMHNDNEISIYKLLLDEYKCICTFIHQSGRKKVGHRQKEADRY